MPDIVWSKTFQAGAQLPAADLEQMKTDITSKVNGGLDDDNFNPSATFDAARVDDYSATATEMKTVATPGTPGSESLATTIEEELARIRHTLARIQFGNATDQGSALEWYERSPNLLSQPESLARNAGWADFQAEGGTTAPAQWTAVGPAADYSMVTQDTTLGSGVALQITGDAGTGHGLSQAYTAATGLRPSTTYIVTAMAEANSGDTARIVTTGGSANVDVETTSTTPLLLQGFFTTDATPSTVTLSLTAKAASDVVRYSHFNVVPVYATPRTPKYTCVLQQLDAEGSVLSASAALPLALGATTLTNYTDIDDGTNDLSRSIFVPGPGYALRVFAKVSLARIPGTVNLAENVTGILVESTDAGSTFTVRDCTAELVGGNASNPGGTTLSFFYFVPHATAGAHYIFKCMAGSDSNGDLYFPQGIDGVTRQAGVSSLCIELIPAG